MAKKMNEITIKPKEKNCYEYIEVNYDKWGNEKSKNVKEYMYLQNLDYSYIQDQNKKESNLKDKGEKINFNYRLNHLFFLEKEIQDFYDKKNKEKKEKYEIKRIYKMKENQGEEKAEIEFTMGDYEGRIPEELKEYRKNMLDYYKYMNLDMMSENFELEVEKDGKLIIGLGHPNIAETSMTIHKVYGVPYIPGQVLKGIFKNYYIQEVMEENGLEKILKGIDVENKDAARLYNLLFGEKYTKNKDEEQSIRSNIYFFDAYPKEEYIIQEDVMNVHHVKYYNQTEEKPIEPSGEEKLNLIGFYVVKNTKFQVFFAVDRLGIKRVLENYNDKDNEKDKTNYDIEKEMKDIELSIIKIAQKAYTDIGIGAKTGVGYGYVETNSREIL